MLEVRQLVRDELAQVARSSYEELCNRAPQLVKRRRWFGLLTSESYRSESGSCTYRRVLSGGQYYALVTEIFWNDHAGGSLRVMVCVDGGDVPATRPICDSIVVEPTRSADHS